MRVLIVGAGGFLGSRLTGRLAAGGHELVLAGRDPVALRARHPGAEVIGCDLATDRPEDWIPRLIGVAAVINAAGLFRDRNGSSFATVHTRGPACLFEACAAAGVGRVIQISALGADPMGPTGFQRSKAAGDDHLVRLAEERGEIHWVVLRPSIILGPGGGSTRLFASLAALPWPLSIGPGTWSIRPLALADFLTAVEAVLAARGPLPHRLDLVGADLVSTDQVTRHLRAWLGLPPARLLRLPGWVWRAAARLGDRVPGSLLCRDSLTLLEHAHPADPGPAMAALSWRPHPLAVALALTPANPADRIDACVAPLRPSARGALAAIWLAGGLASLRGPSMPASLALVSQLGVTSAALARAAVFGGAGLDLAIGLALLAGVKGSRFAGIQATIVLVYSLLLTLAAPTLWLDPFGALIKNLAVLVLLRVWSVLEAG